VREKGSPSIYARGIDKGKIVLIESGDMEKT
jgi:hypothetical protein